MDDHPGAKQQEVESKAADSPTIRLNRRSALRLAAATGAAALLPACDRRKSAATQGQSAASSATRPAAGSGPAVESSGQTSGSQSMARYPEKTDLILLTDRPPQLETPVRYFAREITPNDAFFVRWHLAGIPTSVDLDTFRLSVSGHVDSSLNLSMAELLKDFEPVSVVAVNQCSGNSRSFFEPPVPGGEWGNGAVGNAKWTGVRLTDLLAKAKVKPGAVDVSFQGLDRPVLPTTPQFVKSLSFEHANDGQVMIAYAMNDAPLPMLNGFPIRLIVPGWFGTYWVKALNVIQVLPDKFHNFWMDKAYRIPNNGRAEEKPGDLAKDTVPINHLFVRSLFATPQKGERIKVGQPYEVTGVAFSGGDGIKKVEVSTDGGKTWAAAELGRNLGNYSFRRWTYSWQPAAAGAAQLMVHATDNKGQTQPEKPTWNRSGYARNVIERVDVTVEA